MMFNKLYKTKIFAYYIRMNFKRLLYSKIGQIIISMLLGLGLASMFRKACTKRNCIKFTGPSVGDVKDKIYKFNDKCYSFTTRAESCNKNKKQVSFA